MTGTVDENNSISASPKYDQSMGHATDAKGHGLGSDAELGEKRASAIDPERLQWNRYVHVSCSICHVLSYARTRGRVG